MAIANRTVATAPVKTAQQPVAPAGKVNTAQLVRGQVYYYKDTRFEYGKVVVISDELASVLEDLVQEVRDGDGEIFEKPLFDVRRGVAAPVAEDTASDIKKKATRLPVRQLRKVS